MPHEEAAPPLLADAHDLASDRIRYRSDGGSGYGREPVHLGLCAERRRRAARGLQPATGGLLMSVQKRGPNRYEAFTYVPKAQRKPGEGPKRYIGTYTKRGDAVQAFEDAKRALRGKPATDEMTVAEY